MSLDSPAAVTFDCWSTLIYERDSGTTHERRVTALEAALRERGHAVERQAARAALDAAWQRHIELWGGGVASGAIEITEWALAGLGVSDAALASRLAERLGEVILETEGGIVALEGAGDTLERLAGMGVRRGLICDTGFTPGRVVRRLLEDAGLLEHLEVCVFSDEAGVPKPHPQVFRAALRALGTEAARTVHVGDLLRTDVAGARAAGMGTVRIRWHHDDPTELPEADRVADSHAHLHDQLCELLALRAPRG